MKLWDERESDGVGISWWLFGIALAIVLVVSLDTYLGWIVFGLFLYYVARPIARRLRNRGLSPGLASLLTLALIILPFVGLLGAIVVVTFGQLSAIRPADIEQLAQTLFPGFETGTIPTDPAQLYDAATQLLREPSIRNVLGQFGGFVGTFATQSYNLFLALVFVFFLVRDEDRISGWFETTVAGSGTTSHEYLRAIDRGLNSVFFGYTLTIFVIIITSALIYNGLNLIAPPGMAIPQTMLVAVATGLATLIPLVGRSIVYLVVVLYLAIIAVETDPTRLWFPIFFYLFMALVFDNVIRTYVRPYLSGRMFHTGLIMFAYLLGPPIFGWYGIFLGPLIMVIAVQFLWVVFPDMLPGASGAPDAPSETGESDTGEESGARKSKFEERDRGEFGSEDSSTRS
ncbi:Predicted PurR-regulated permease PerM [Haladaptatus litoreus]|uniref:Predicted PurR-regulated permease PerM n=1 Tax=Haladaptatus litoreus TaxID=553468 RepID=A0A1N7E9W8_9EURY|nr:AI-2E family transporter [Haladaptatus litoreus]SIR84826.1 Predicted PurR-regulated permease PerM [Haladaptatus litoreus]